MTENKNVLTALRFDTVDGLYLQDNDVEHEDYVLIEDLTDWLNENTRDLTNADIDDMAMTGGHARRNYSIYEKFVDVTALRGELTQSIAQPEERQAVFREKYPKYRLLLNGNVHGLGDFAYLVELMTSYVQTHNMYGRDSASFVIENVLPVCVMCKKQLNLATDAHDYADDESLWCMPCAEQESDTGDSY